jgi:hypothetical protein
MNIFVLDYDPKKAAEYHNDKHVVKMILETGQILDTVRYKKGLQPVNCKPTHINHPCVKWTEISRMNYEWLCELGLELLNQYTLRYNKIHKYQSVIEEIYDKINELEFQKTGLTPFVLAMPDNCKKYDPVESYRNYYIKEKYYFSKWKLGNIPEWFKLEENIICTI